MGRQNQNMETGRYVSRHASMHRQDVSAQLNHGSPFLQLFQSIVAKELNRLYGREGHFWSSRARVEEIISETKAEALLGYGACNASPTTP